MLRLLVFGALSISLVAARVVHSTSPQSYNISETPFAQSLLDIREDKEPKSYEELMIEGKKNYQAWKNKEGPDEPIPEWISKERHQLHWSKDEASPYFNIEPDRVLWAVFQFFVKAKSPINTRSGKFMVDIIVEHGVLVAKTVYWNEANIEGDKDDKRYFSQIAWWMWVTAVKGHIDLPQVDYSSLRYFWYTTINNAATTGVLDEATSGLGAGLHPIGPECDDSPYWAILATPLGYPIIAMLTEHKREMKGRGIEFFMAVKRIGQNGNEYDMYAVFTNL